MQKSNTILIADRNPHIRGFLRRELAACGYHVILVGNGKELLNLIHSHSRIDLLVLDPDFPGMDVIDVTRKLADRRSRMPVVLYSITRSGNLTDVDAENVFHVEKNGQSIDTLIATIRKIFADSAADGGSAVVKR